MKFLQYILSIMLFIPFCITAQQSEEIRFNIDNQFLTNPATLAPWNKTAAGLYYQSAFSSIKNSPTTIFTGIQLPMYDQNTSLGFGLSLKNEGVIRNINLLMASSYKLKGLFRDLDYLAIGGSFQFSQIKINGSKIKANDLLDPLVIEVPESAIGFNFGVGIFYSSLSKRKRRRNCTVFQLGASIKKVVPQNINLESLSYQETFQSAGMVKFIIPKSGLDIIPMFEIFREGPITNFIATTQIIVNKTVVLGTSIDIDKTIGFQFGFNYKSNSGYGRESSLYRILVNGTLPFGEIDKYINSGIGIELQYIFAD